MMKAVNYGLEAVNEEVKAVNEGEEAFFLSEEVEAVDNLQNRLSMLKLHAQLASSIPFR